MMRFTPSTLAAATLIGFWVIEVTLRRSRAAKALKGGAFDRGSSALIWLAYLITAGCIASHVPGPEFPVAIDWIGAIASVIGVGIRIVAFRTLGPSYTRTLHVDDEQEMVTRGIYRRIRHPGYLSSLLIWGGAAIASGSMAGAGAALAALIVVYAYRIHREEEMLIACFGARYCDYQRSSWRLAPFIY